MHSTSPYRLLMLVGCDQDPSHGGRSSSNNEQPHRYLFRPLEAHFGRQAGDKYCTISTVSSRILKICWPRWPINFLLSSSDLKQGLFFWPLRVTELTVEMVQYVGIDYRSE